MGSSLIFDNDEGGGGGLEGGGGSWKETLLAVAKVGVGGLRNDWATANDDPLSGGCGAATGPLPPLPVWPVSYLWLVISSDALHK